MGVFQVAHQYKDSFPIRNFRKRHSIPAMKISLQPKASRYAHLSV